MKSITICLLAILFSMTAFSQKAQQKTDTTLKSYLTYSCAKHPQYVSNVQAKCPVCQKTMNLTPKEQMKAEVVKLYTCSMDPDVLCTKPGKCPVCKMDLVEFKP